jgi:hypothetical protein
VIVVESLYDGGGVLSGSTITCMMTSFRVIVIVRRLLDVIVASERKWIRGRPSQAVVVVLGP